MYHVTYKNVLRANKREEDFMEWLKVHWPIQQKWGARSVKLWNASDGEKNILFCRYTVENLDQWNQAAMHPDSEAQILELNKVVDIDQMSIKITLLSSENA